MEVLINFINYIRQTESGIYWMVRSESLKRAVLSVVMLQILMVLYQWELFKPIRVKTR